MKCLFVDLDSVFVDKVKRTMLAVFDNCCFNYIKSNCNYTEVCENDVFFLEANNENFVLAEKINSVSCYKKTIIFCISEEHMWKHCQGFNTYWVLDQYDTSNESLELAIHRLKKRIDKIGLFLKIKHKDTIVILKMSEIICVFKKDNYVIVKTKNSEYELYSTLKNIADKFDENIFMQVNSGVIVRKDAIVKYYNKLRLIQLYNNQQFSVSRSLTKELRQHFLSIGT